MAKRNDRVGSRAAEAKVDEALRILAALDFPIELTHSAFLRRRLGRVLLAVCNINPSTVWGDAAVWGDRQAFALTQKGILAFINVHYGEKISPGSYDDIMRKHLRHLIPAQLVLSAANRPDSPINDSTRGFALNPAATGVIRTFGTPRWDEEVRRFTAEFGSLRQRYERERVVPTEPIVLPDGVEVRLASGRHNDLQIAIIKRFLPTFAPHADVLYLGDADKKEIILKTDKLRALRFFEIAHDTLPDIVAYDERRNWLFLIEAVHSANPIAFDRHVKFEQLTEDCTAGIVYVSVFADRRTFSKWAEKISWQTEVWIVAHPTHMIHFNGDRFLGPYPRGGE